MPEQSSRQNKVYTEATATIAFVTTTRDDAEYLMISFLSRRGLDQHGSPRYEELRRKVASWRARVTVSYRVHGGWKSDFIKKIESDALDAGIEIRELDVVIDRHEIPDECPRPNCVPCGEAVAALTRGSRKAVKDTAPPPPPPSEIEKEPEQTVRRLNIFRRRNV